VQSTVLFETFRDFGFEYEANTNLPYWENIEPYTLWNGLVKVLHNFEDDVHYMYGHSFEDAIIDLFSDKLNVFSMHPIHIFLNTECAATYTVAKKHYKDPKELLKFRNTKKQGTRDLLIKLLENHHHYFSNTFTVIEYLKVRQYLKS
jgi:hypothetical protein